MSEFCTLIVSDIHLGSPVSRAEALSALLREHTFQRLILLGDVFENLKFDRLHPAHWELVRTIQALSKASSEVEVVWIEGNHDEGLCRRGMELLGQPVVEEFVWEAGGTKFVALHGHQFDSLVAERPLLTEVGSHLNQALQKLDHRDLRLSRWAKRMSKKLSGQSAKVAEKATAYGQEQRADYVFCGHTHLAMTAQAGSVRYINTGCWTDIPSTFVGITNQDVHLIPVE